jgi:hypothetical protein
VPLNAVRAVCAKYSAFAIFAAVCALGCHKDPVAPTPLTLEQLAPMLQQSLATASQEAQSQSGKYISAMQKHEWADALADLKELRATPGLTEDQRTLLARAHLTTIQQLNDAAEKGDEGAATVFDNYRATK